jgi:translation elongation factor EF-G
VIKGLTQVIRSCGFVPVLVAAGGSETGVARLLDDIVDLLPSPKDRPASLQKEKLAMKPLPLPILVPWLSMFGKPLLIPL